MTTPTAIPLKLRRLIWDDGGTSIDPEDYEVIDGRGERVGRMYRTIAVGGGDAWNWTGDEPSARRPGPDAPSRAGGAQGRVGNL